MTVYSEFTIALYNSHTIGVCGDNALHARTSTTSEQGQHPRRGVRRASHVARSGGENHPRRDERGRPRTKTTYRYTHTSKNGAHRRRRAVAGLGPRSPLPGARSRRARSGRWSAQACGPAWAGDRIEFIENSKRLMAVATRRARTVLGGPRLWFCQVSRWLFIVSPPPPHPQHPI